MPSPSKDKGDRAERDVLAYLLPHCPNLRRGKAGAEKDLGDLMNFRDRDGDEWTLQVADRNWRAYGEIERKAEETAGQSERAGTHLWALIVKRAGTTDVGRWFVYLEAAALADVIGAFNNDGEWERGTWRSFAWSGAGADLACITVRAWLALVAPSAVSGGVGVPGQETP